MTCDELYVYKRIQYNTIQMSRLSRILGYTEICCVEVMNREVKVGGRGRKHIRIYSAISMIKRESIKDYKKQGKSRNGASSRFKSRYLKKTEIEAREKEISYSDLLRYSYLNSYFPSLHSFACLSPAIQNPSNIPTKISLIFPSLIAS